MPKVSKTECRTPWLRAYDCIFGEWYGTGFYAGQWFCCERLDEKWDVADAKRIRVHVSSVPVKGAIKARLNTCVSMNLNDLYSSMGWLDDDGECLINHVWWWVEVPDRG